MVRVVRSSPSRTVPIWIKIERRGESVTGYVGPDGVSWTPIQHTRFTLPENCFIGLAVSSRNAKVLSTAIFSKVQLSDGFVTNGKGL